MKINLSSYQGMLLLVYLKFSLCLSRLAGDGG